MVYFFQKKFIYFYNTKIITFWAICSRQVFPTTNNEIQNQKHFLNTYLEENV